MLSITTLNPDHATLFAAIGELAYSGGMTEWDPNDGEVGWLSNIPWLEGGTKHGFICRGVDEPILVQRGLCVFVC